MLNTYTPQKKLVPVKDFLQIKEIPVLVKVKTKHAFLDLWFKKLY